jgi:hypothetical protein
MRNKMEYLKVDCYLELMNALSQARAVQMV